MKKKAIILGLVLSAGVFVCTVPADAGISKNGMGRNGMPFNGLTPNGFSRNGMPRNGLAPNGIDRNGASPTPGLDFTTISHQRLGK